MECRKGPTIVPASALRFGERLIGGIFGYGLDAEIIAAYQWMIDDYNPDDELFIFGL